MQEDRTTLFFIDARNDRVSLGLLFPARKLSKVEEIRSKPLFSPRLFECKLSNFNFETDHPVIHQAMLNDAG